MTTRPVDPPDPLPEPPTGAPATPPDAAKPRARQRRGFAAMPAALVAELGARGGKASQRSGLAHQWTADSARAAGAKGGRASRGGKGKLPPPEEPPAR